MSDAPTILHADMDAFFAAVEQRDDPGIRGKPVIVGGLGKRGVVSTASYEARVFGVHSALPMAVARMRCPDGVYLPARMDVYAAVSRQVFDVFGEFTPLVESLSLDEAFLDVTASKRLFGDGPAIAAAIKRRVHEVTGLRISLGVAASKYVAKVASDVGKPDGLVVVPQGEEREFLAPLPVSRLWGAGRVTQEKLAGFGLRTIGDIQRKDAAELVRLLGETSARHFHALAHGRDRRAVSPARDARSISHETTFGEDVSDRDELLRVIMRQSQGVGRRLRRQGLRAATVRIKIRFPPFETHTRQRRLETPSADDVVIYRAAKRLFEQANPRLAPVRLIGVGCADPVAADEHVQLDLFSAEHDDRRDRLMDTLDRIRDRYGNRAIEQGGALPDRD